MRLAQRHALIAVFATLFVVFAVLALTLTTTPARDMRVGAAAAGLPPGVVPPPVEPVEYLALAPDDARALNEAQPFVDGPFPAARPFIMAGDGVSQARAVDCLAAAVLYEAGDDAVGQRAVAQVVLNRARHPAYPKSICGVVFQGSERSTGCQFTFTCDGALARRYASPVWERARGVAVDALTGAVYEPVGLATHYHTDWVRPYWSGSLDKLARVGTHLFFRWQGFWGTPRAFVGNLSGAEAAVPKMALLSPIHASGVTAEEIAEMEALAAAAEVSPDEVAAAVSSIISRPAVQLGDTIILTLSPAQPPESFPALAAAACEGRTYCKVMGWTNGGLAPTSEAMSEAARAAMSFSYLRDEQRGLERALWNCTEFGRDTATQCMRRGG